MLDLRQILQNNLKVLLKGRPGSRMQKAADMEVADGSLGRIVYGTGNPTLEVIERISTFFRVEPWQLLAPDLGQAMGNNDSAQDTAESGGLRIVRQFLHSQGLVLDEARAHLLCRLLGDLLQLAQPLSEPEDLPGLNPEQARKVAGAPTDPSADTHRALMDGLVEAAPKAAVINKPGRRRAAR